MPQTTRHQLETRLTEMGLPFQTHEHEPVFTVEESADLHARIPGAHTKNLFLKDAKGRLFLVVAHHETPVALKKLHTKLGAARFSFGKPDLLMEALGVRPGSVTPFSVMNDPDGRVTLVMDEALMSHGLINAHPLDNAATTSIARDDLIAFVRELGHEPIIADLTGPEAEED